MLGECACKKSVSCLVVAAHPDDEVLGAGATMFKLAQAGNDVNVLIMSGRVNARENRPGVDELNDDAERCMKLLGVRRIIRGDFPNIEFNTVPHLRLVQFIEAAILETGANIVITHHPADLNNDHLHTSLSCQEAVRMFQRRSGVEPINQLLYMEVPSATDWGLNEAMRGFSPNTFVEVGKQGVDRKLAALSQYRGVMRDFPHPRSRQVIMGLAAYRGGQAAMEYAEAFQSVFARGLYGQVVAPMREEAEIE